MKTAVNLLPVEYSRAIQRRRQMRILLLSGIACLCAGLLWWKIASMKIRPILQRTGDIRLQIIHEKNASKSLEQSQILGKKVESIQSIRNEMTEPIDMASVMALLSQLMPPETGLTKLGISLPQLPEQKPAKPGVVPANEMAKPPAPIVIDMMGIAKTNADVARCVGALADHPLFSNVKLSNSKQLLDGKLSLVGFQITMEIPVNRKFVAPVKGLEATAHVE